MGALEYPRLKPGAKFSRRLTPAMYTGFAGESNDRNRAPDSPVRLYFFTIVFARYRRMCSCVSGAAQLASISSTEATAMWEASRR